MKKIFTMCCIIAILLQVVGFTTLAVENEDNSVKAESSVSEQIKTKDTEKSDTEEQKKSEESSKPENKETESKIDTDIPDETESRDSKEESSTPEENYIDYRILKDEESETVTSDSPKEVQNDYIEEKKADGWTQNEKGQWLYYRNGEALTQWQQLDWSGGKSWFYFDKDGIMQTGWKNDITGWEGEWFHFDSNGVMSTGWKNNTIGWGSEWFYFGDNGVMRTSWQYIDNEWYYFASNGVMQSNWQNIDTVWYYFYIENDGNGGKYGSMARGRYICGYWIRESGEWDGNLQNMCDMANSHGSATGYIIVVNRNIHKVAIFISGADGWINIKYCDCGDGAPGTETPDGVFEIQERGYYFDSGSSRCFWWTQFYEDYLFHSMPCDKNGNYVDDRIGQAVSHGCVRLEMENAKYIYDNVPSSTAVVIYS